MKYYRRRRTKDRECASKKKYPSMAAAESEVRRLRSRDPMHAYECPFCPKFHIGHAKRRDLANSKTLWFSSPLWSSLLLVLLSHISPALRDVIRFDDVFALK